MIELVHSKECLIFGCGNPLFGDDGFGPAVIASLQADYSIPGHAACIDAGTAIRDMLFDILLSEKRPRQIIVVDSSQARAASPGEIAEIDVDAIKPEKVSDFSLHQFPTTNMLKEIKAYTDVDVRVLVVRPEAIPPEIAPGLSGSVQAAVPEMCRLVLEMISKEES
ncbi:MAG TPA: hydrogenase maturation protease [Desulfosalsimonadaceae bacterium]|nr:hydrogenase maturation protease [Desulfosalsimonadaceae bacterium]